MGAFSELLIEEHEVIPPYDEGGEVLPLMAYADEVTAGAGADCSTRASPTSDRLTSELFAGGYGYVPKAVMQDKELHAIAKAVYCYLSCFADKQGAAYPSRALICRELGITKDTLTKYLKQLTERGYVCIEKNKRQGRFDNNVYRLPCHKLSDTVLSDTVLSDTVLSDTVKWALTIPVINNTSITEPVLNNTSERARTRSKKPDKQNFGEYGNVMLTVEEHRKLIDEYGEKVTADYIGRVDEYIEQNGEKYKRSHYATIRKWVREDREKNTNKGGYDPNAGYTDIYERSGGKEK